MTICTAILIWPIRLIAACPTARISPWPSARTPRPRKRWWMSSNRDRLTARGRITHLSLVALRRDQVEPVARFALGGS